MKNIIQKPKLSIKFLTLVLPPSASGDSEQELKAELFPVRIREKRHIQT